MSPRQTRVTPLGEIVADPARGLFMGNRGCLHDADGRLGRARWRHKAWICCLLQFRGRHRPVMTPGRYTELFFLDEAVALSAGHRPCAECRRADFRRFALAFGVGTAGRLDAALHAARLCPSSRDQRRHTAPAAALPDGAFVLLEATPHLILGRVALPWKPSGYGAARPRPVGEVTVLTPAPTVAALAAGYRPVLHPSAAAGPG
ncbi:hypothetical protein [Rhodovulum visakhapatnamense]|uniref:Metal binding Ada-like protein n=1 Tax=Rhodovulum visakhapatnamense TaxID=364297 RepID=A0A4R8G348_9RHOB|nr:hypothetical protein [Rhodovulum visakhapatnamense]TDX32599.1 hypothetical protein EV657_103170 [Rhodovulum visakhapatnamense]